MSTIPTHMSEELTQASPNSSDHQSPNSFVTRICQLFDMYPVKYAPQFLDPTTPDSRSLSLSLSLSLCLYKYITLLRH